MTASTPFNRWTAAALTFLVLAAVATLAYLPTTRLSALHQQATLYHTHIQALLELKHIAEMTHSAQRSYLLNRDPHHLQARETGLRQFSDSLSTLSRLPVEDAAETALFGELTQQAAAWQAALNTELQDFQAGALPSTELLEPSERGMEQLDNSITRLLHDEQRHDLIRIPKELETQSRWTFASFISLLLAVLGGIIWHTRRLQQEIEAHIGADRALQHANVKLETRVLARTRDLQAEMLLHTAAKTRLQHANRTLRVIACANEAINQNLEEAALLSHVCNALVQEGGYRLCWVGVPVQDAAKSIRVLSSAGVTLETIEAERLSWDEVRGAGCPLGLAIREGAPALVQDALNDAQFGPWRESARHLGFASVLALPLPLNDSATLVLCVYAQEPDAFDEDEVALLSQLDANLAHALNTLRSEDALSKARQQVSLLLESLPLILYTCRAEGDYGFTYISPNVRQVTGYAHSDLIGTTGFWAEHLHPDDRARVFDNLAGLFKQSKLRHEYRWRVADGNYRWFFDASTLVRHAGNAPSHIVGAWLDITERKQDEQALARLQRSQEQILNSVGEGIHGIDLAGNITFENPAAVAMLGWSVQELVGHHAHSMMHHTRADGSPYPQGECHIYAALHDGATHHIEDEVFWRKDGTSFPIAYTSTPMKNEAGEITGAIVSFRDITGRKQDEQALAVAQHKLQIAFDLISRKNALLQESSRARSEFLAAMSHELKTPLNAVIGFSDLLLNDLAGAVSEEQRDFLRDIHEAGNHLLVLISDIIDFARMDAGYAKLDLSQLNAKVWLAECILPWRERMAAAGLSFTLKFEPPLGNLWLDAAKARRIITNLLSNAIKFTPAGGQITLSARKVILAEAASGAQTDAGSGTDNELHTAPRYLQFSVRDTGSGIKPELLPRLFEPFHQGEGGLDRRYSGVGLGLAMVRRLVELHAYKCRFFTPHLPTHKQPKVPH